MKSLKHNIGKQLISIGIIIFGIVFISLGIILPKILVPIYERNIYNYLRQPLFFVDNEVVMNFEDNDIAFIHVNNNNQIKISSNYNQIIKIAPKQILDNINYTYGKIQNKKDTYYYYAYKSENFIKVAITNNRYVLQIEQDVLIAIFPILMITLLLILVLITVWARRLVIKIYYLKEKVANIDKDNYLEKYKDEYHVDDELNALSDAIDDMHLTLKMQEEYKSQMYQNISHDFKTPLTVIKSYMEAIEDRVLTREEGARIIKEQVQKLENKVHSLLYLNKLNYLKEQKNQRFEKVDIAPILSSSVEKFKFERTDINWNMKIDDKTIFNGTVDMWEAIIDNMLNNFIRYAETSIRITVKNNRIIFYNDGPNIDESLLYDIFTPYKKGINGRFGLGLSIIRKTISLMGYEISVKNEKKGVSFIIK